MANPAPLNIVFFDVGGTLGEVETAAGRRQLRVFALTAGLLTAMRQTLVLMRDLEPGLRPGCSQSGRPA